MTFALLTWATAKVFAFPLTDSLCAQSDYIAIGTVLRTEMIRSEHGKYYHLFSARIEQSGQGGHNHSDTITLIPGTIITGLEYEYYRPEPALDANAKYLLLLQKKSTDTGYQLTCQRYLDSDCFYAGGSTPLDYFNRVELLCDTSLKLDPKGNLRTAIMSRDGRRARKIELNDQSIIVADVRSVRRGHHDYGPTKIIYKARFSFDDGRKSGRYRRKVKKSSFRNVITTWTFRRDGVLCLKCWKYGLTACW